MRGLRALPPERWAGMPERMEPTIEKMATDPDAHYLVRPILEAIGV